MGATIQAIPNANVQWTDAVGGAQIIVPNLRFANWTPGAVDIGPSREALGTGLTFKFVERRDYTASFQMQALVPNTMPLMQRLKLWMEGGGEITVNTQDSQLNSYACVRAPGSNISWTWDTMNLWFTMSLAVKNTIAQPMVCYYSTQASVGAQITVTPAQLALGPNVGQSAPLTVSVTDASGNPMSVTPTFSSTNGDIASVNVAGVVTAVATGSCTIMVSAGGLQVLVPVTVTLAQSPNVLTMSPTGLSFTQTTYTAANPTPGKSGVPSQTLAATLTSATGQSVPITAGMLIWAATGTGVSLADQGNGQCIVTAIAGSQSGTVTATVVNSIGTSNVITASATYTTVAANPIVLIPSTYTFALTAVNQTISLQIKATLDQYGVTVP